MLQQQAPRPNRRTAPANAAEESNAPKKDPQSKLGNSGVASKMMEKKVGGDLGEWSKGDGKEQAFQNGVSRPDKLKKGQKGALIGAEEISLTSSAEGSGQVVAKVPGGTPADLLKSSGSKVQVRVRTGDKSQDGWVDASMFSDQPGVGKDEENSKLRDDYVFSKFEGDLSPQNPTGKDARQGYLGNCFLIGTMAAVANASPSVIKEMVKYNKEKGTYTVRFYEEQGKGKFVPVYIEVDSYLPTSKENHGDPVYGGDQGGPLWSAIIEKAYAKWKGGYDVIGEGGVGSETMQEFTGGASSSKDPSSMKEEEVIPYFEAAKKAGKAIYAGTKDGKKSEVQTPFKGSGDGNYTADVQQTHKWNEINPGTFRVQDLKGKAGSAYDVGQHGDMEGALKGSNVKSGNVEYKKNKAQIQFKPGFAPANAADLQVVFQYEGVIDLNKFVIANHAYAFEGIQNGLLQFYNPWGSYQPKPLTAREFLDLYDSLSVNQPPEQKTAGK